MSTDPAAVIDENRETIESLRAVVAAPLRVIPFVGAGLSAGFDYKRWGPFLLKVAADIQAGEQVQELLGNNDFEGAADCVAARYGITGFQAAIREEFAQRKIEGRRIDGPASLLWQLTSGPVITTNFDRVIETAFQQAGIDLRVIVGAAVDTVAKNLSLNSPFLLKIHGDFEERTDLILTRKQYNRHYGSGMTVRNVRPLPGLLYRIMSGSTSLLFLGCSLNADRTMQILEHAHKMSAESLNHYAIVQKPASEKEFARRRKFLSRHGIHAIWYPEGKYECIGIVLQHILAPMRPGLSARPATRKTEIQDRIDARVQRLTAVFVGREKVLEALDRHVDAGARHGLVVTAPAGFGKSAVMAAWVRRRQNVGDAVCYHFFSAREGITAIEEAYANLVQQISAHRSRPESARNATERGSRQELFDALRKWSSDEARKLVVVVDGLDEADRLFQRPGGPTLPEKVSFLVAGRAGEHESPPGLHDWLESSERLPLGPMDSETVAAWLRATGSPKLARAAADGRFTTRLSSITSGYPLYLSFVIEELVHKVATGLSPNRVELGNIGSFDRYVREELTALTVDRKALGLQSSRPKRAFALLCVTPGPVTDQDLQVIAGVSAIELPWRVTRWFSTERAADGTLTHRLHHEELRKIFASYLTGAIAGIGKALLGHCRKTTYTSHYSLRYYAAQLRDSGDLQGLHQLAADHRYWEAQRHRFPGEPEVALGVTELTEITAWEKEEYLVFAESAVRSGQRLALIMADWTPLAAFRAGYLNGALTLAKLSGPERELLWLLLLHWEGVETGQSTAEISNYLVTRPPVRLTRWKLRLSYLLLAELQQSDRAAFAAYLRKPAAPGPIYADRLGSTHLHLLRPMLQGNASWKDVLAVLSGAANDPTRQVLAVELAQLGRSGEAYAAIESIGHQLTRAKAYAVLALTLAEAGHREQASECLGRSNKLVPQWRSEYDVFSDKLFGIRAAAEKVAGLDSAEETLGAVQSPEERAVSLAAMTRIDLQQGQSPATAFDRARECIDLIRRPGSRAIAHARVSQQYEPVHREWAEHHLNDAIAAAEAIRGEEPEVHWDKSEAWSRIVLRLVRLGQLDRASEMSQRLAEKTDEWEEIVYSEASQDVDAALARIRSLGCETTSPWPWVEPRGSDLLVSVAAGARQAGEKGRSREVIESVLRFSEQDVVVTESAYNNAFCDLAVVCAEVGEAGEALNVANLISENRRGFAKVNIGEICARRGNLKIATEVASERTDAGPEPPRKLVEEIGLAELRGGDVEAAEATFRDLPWSSRPRLQVALATHLARSHGAAAAADMLQDIYDKRPAARGMFEIVSALRDPEDVDPLRTTVMGWTGQSDVRLIAYAGIGRGLLMRGHNESALEWFSLAEEEAAGAQESAEREKSIVSGATWRPWVALAVEQKCTGLDRESKASLTRARGAAEPYEYGDVLTKYGEGLADNGNLPEALAVCGEIRQSSKKIELLDAIASSDVAPPGFGAIVMEVWSGLSQRGSRALWAARLLAIAGDKAGFRKVIDERPRDLATACGVVAALGRLYPKLAYPLAQKLGEFKRQVAPSRRLAAP